jgi:peptide/nickel transport system ATP-binding protein
MNLKKEINSDFELNYDSIGFIPQNPFTSLSSMTKIKNQFFCSQEKKEEVLKLVDLDISLLNKFPSQLSGGQIQRVVIAIALSRNIKLLLLDEPTTALDEKNKKNIINLINDLKKRLNILILFVTHDIDSIKNICDEIIILKNGKIIEKGLTQEILNSPKESYTKKLIDSTFKNKDFRK